MKTKKSTLLQASVSFLLVSVILISSASGAYQYDMRDVDVQTALEQSNFGYLPSDLDTRVVSSRENMIRNIVKWDGEDWSPLTCGRNRTVNALVEYDTNLIVGGIFNDETSGSCPPEFINDSIFTWDGLAWDTMNPVGQPLIAFIYDEFVWDGNLIIGGFFFGETGIHHLARYNGFGDFVEVGGGIYHEDYGANVITLNEYDDRLVVGGRFQDVESYGGIFADGLALYDGNIWDPIGASERSQIQPSNVYTSSLVIGDDLYVGGQFRLHQDGIILKNLARYGPYGPGGSLAWDTDFLLDSIDPGEQGMVLSLVEYNGDLIVGGFFTEINGEPVNHIARWDGNQWYDLAGGLSGYDPAHTRVQSLYVYNGNLIVGGCFNQAGGTPAKNIAVWDGSTWSAIADDTLATPFSENIWHGVAELCEYQGDLYVAGNFIYDGQPPVTTCTLYGQQQGDVYVSNVTVVLEADDDLSGVNKTMYKVDDGEWIEYLISFEVTEEGEHTIYYYSVDNAGNVEEEQTTSFEIDFTSDEPVLEIDISGGFRSISAICTNSGTAPATDVDVSLLVTGGLLNLINKTTSETFPSIAPGESVTISITDVFGLGPIDITATANGAEEASAEIAKEGLQFLIFTLI